MALREVESAEGGVVVDKYTNAPMKHFCAQSTQELGELVRQWSDPAMRARP